MKKAIAIALAVALAVLWWRVDPATVPAVLTIEKDPHHHHSPHEGRIVAPVSPLQTKTPALSGVLNAVDGLSRSDHAGLEFALQQMQAAYLDHDDRLLSDWREWVAHLDQLTLRQSHFFIAFALMNPKDPRPFIESMLEMGSKSESVTLLQAYALDRLVVRLERGTADPRSLADLAPRLLQTIESTPDRSLVRQAMVVLSLIDDSSSRFLLQKAAESRPAGDATVFQDLMAW